MESVPIGTAKIESIKDPIRSGGTTFVLYPFALRHLATLFVSNVSNMQDELTL
jgi:hypothetical protein